MLKIGFLGPKGTFSQEALRVYTGDSYKYSELEFNNIYDIINAVNTGCIDEAFVPIENSLEGAVNETLDLMSSDIGIFIKAEVVLRIRQNLLSRKGMKLEDIKCVLSHPQGIGQCRQYINKSLPNTQTRVVHSTAGAAQMVAASDEPWAAIGSAVAAEVYGLDVLIPDIQDGYNNFTRFIAISLKETDRTGNDKTSIVFSTDDEPGSLYRVLDIFNLWDINMARIESRPAKKQLGKYIFFVDIVGHKDDSDVRDALTMVRRKTSYYKFLGSYPVFKYA